MSLALLDEAVESIYNSIDAVGQLDSTYFIFASDNGGCPEGGGRNGDLRGSKGTLFEGEPD
jgi:arylsulfatase A-like enzyme